MDNWMVATEAVKVLERGLFPVKQVPIWTPLLMFLVLILLKHLILTLIFLQIILILPSLI